MSASSTLRPDFTRPPTRPSAYIREDILDEYGLKQDELAVLLKVSRHTVNELVNDRRSITAMMALRLGRLTQTSPEFWLNLQRAVDLWEAANKDEALLPEIRPLARKKGSAPSTE